MERLKWRQGLKGFAGVGSDGSSGGFTLCWDENLPSYTVGFLCAVHRLWFMDVANDKTWHATFVYGEPRVESRVVSYVGSPHKIVGCFFIIMDGVWRLQRGLMAT